MIIVTEQSESKLVAWLEQTRHSIEDEHPPRALHIHYFEGLYSDDREGFSATILEHLGKLFQGDDIRAYRCYDDTMIIVARGKMSSNLSAAYRLLLEDLKRPANKVALFTMGENWQQLRALCEEKNFDAQQKSKSAMHKQAASAKERSRDAVMNLHIAPELIASLAERRKNRKHIEVMVVEDDPFSLTLVNRSLRPTYRVTCAQDGYDAVATYALKAPDIIFLDIELPDASGHDVLHKLLSIDPDAFIVMLSGNGSKENVLSAMNNGAKGFIGKPFAQEKLLGYIQRTPAYAELETKKEK